MDNFRSNQKPKPIVQKFMKYLDLTLEILEGKISEEDFHNKDSIIYKLFSILFEIYDKIIRAKDGKISANIEEKKHECLNYSHSTDRDKYYRKKNRKTRSRKDETEQTTSFLEQKIRENEMSIENFYKNVGENMGEKISQAKILLKNMMEEINLLQSKILPDGQLDDMENSTTDKKFHISDLHLENDSINKIILGKFSGDKLVDILERKHNRERDTKDTKSGKKDNELEIIDKKGSKIEKDEGKWKNERRENSKAEGRGEIREKKEEGKTDGKKEKEGKTDGKKEKEGKTDGKTDGKKEKEGKTDGKTDGKKEKERKTDGKNEKKGEIDGKKEKEVLRETGETELKKGKLDAKEETGEFKNSQTIDSHQKISDDYFPKVGGLKNKKNPVFDTVLNTGKRMKETSTDSRYVGATENIPSIRNVLTSSSFRQINNKN